MAFLNFSKIVLKSRYSYNFKTIFLTVFFLSTGFLLWPALIWYIELSSIIKWRFSHEKKAKEGRKGKLFIDLCCTFLHNIQGYTAHSTHTRGYCTSSSIQKESAKNGTISACERGHHKLHSNISP